MSRYFTFCVAMTRASRFCVIGATHFRSALHLNSFLPAVVPKSPAAEDPRPKHHQEHRDDTQGEHDPVNRLHRDRSVLLDIGIDGSDEEISQVMHQHGWQQAAGLEGNIAVK
jgi:hypothetical protein